MKVLHITSHMNPEYGGVVQAVHTIVQALDTVDVYSEVLCLENPQVSYVKDFPNIHGLGIGKTAWNYHPKLVEWLRGNLSKYDVVIVHGMWQYHNYALYRVAKRLRCMDRVWVMPHGMLDPYFQKAPERRLKAIRNCFFWKFIESRIVNLAAGLLFTCEQEKRLAATTFSPYNPISTSIVGLSVIAPPVYIKEMRSAFLSMSGLSADEKFLLFLSRIHEKKGVDLLVNAYLTLQREGRKLPHLVIAGPGAETEYGQRVRDLAAKGQNIHFPGMLSGAEKWGAFYGAEAFILPSHQENFGIAVVEALACGKPVLISDQVNIWREIQQEEAGLVGKDTEEGALQLLNDWLLTPDTKRESISKRALEVYKKYFTLERVAESMQEVLNLTKKEC